MSSAKMVASCSTSGTSPLMILRARPSAIAVLPTPGSPTNSGLFFWRRQSTWMVRSTSLLAADQRIDVAVARLLVEVDAIGVERVLARLALFALHRLILVDAAHRARLGHAGALGDAVADVLDRVEARHLLLLQEVGGMALALGEDGDEHVGAGHLLAARRLHVHDGAMDDALEAGGRLRLGAILGDEGAELVVEIVGDARAQRLEIDRAGAHDGGGVAIVDKSEQQMLERRVLVAALVGGFERAMQRAFQALREGWQG